MSSMRMIAPPLSDGQPHIQPMGGIRMPVMPVRAARGTARENLFCCPPGTAAVSEGFTLLEVMIAMVILAIALLAVYQSQSQSVSMAGSSRFLTTASLLAQSRMADIDDVTDPQKKVENGSGDFGEDFPDYTWEVEIGDTQIDLLKKIVLTVKNNRMINRNSYQVTLYKVVRP